MEIITTPTHWDCECEYNYIHPKTLHYCPKCDVFQDDQPDSILSEVVHLKQEDVSLDHTQMECL